MDWGSWKTLVEENHPYIMIKIFKQPAGLKKIPGQSLSLKNLINGNLHAGTKINSSHS